MGCLRTMSLKTVERHMRRRRHLLLYNVTEGQVEHPPDQAKQFW